MARLHKTQKNIIPSGINLPATEQDTARLIALDTGEVIYYNQSFQNLSGLNEDVTGLNITDVLDFSSKKGMSFSRIKNGQHIIALKNSKTELSLQFNWIDTPQKKKYLIVSAEESEVPKQLQQYIADTIGRNEQTAFLNEAKHFLSLSFELQISLSESLKFNGINENFSDLLGFSSDDLNKHGFIDLVYTQDIPFVEKNLDQLKHSDNVVFEARFITAQKKVIWLKCKFKYANNQFLGVAQDITAEIEKETRIIRHKKELAEAEAIAHMGQWRWEIGSENIKLSQEIHHIFGLPENGSFSPTLDNINDMIFREDSGRMEQVFQRAIIEQNDYDIDFRIRRPDGDIRYIRCEGRCEIDPTEDDVVALYGIMQDVTESTERELDLMQAKNSAERAYAAKTQFLANMSHELRTPLNAIIGFSEMIQRQLLGPIGTEKYLEYIQGIRESGEHLLDLISDILDMSKIEAGKYELSLENFNIAKVVRMAVHMMEGRALDANIKIISNIENEDQQIVGDRRAVMQMILNLLSNAVKFSKENSQVTVSLLCREQYLSLKIKDEGIGIPAHKISSITQPFEQVESHYTKEYEGSGLGLAITKELAEKHGGSLYIESAVDVGTTVTIRLPYDAGNTRP